MNESLVISSETGSGKTLSFLIPVLHKLLLKKETEKQQAVQKKSTLSDLSPFALILTPTRELALQTLGILAKIYSKEDNVLFSAGILLKTTPDSHRVNHDIVVTTPGGVGGLVGLTKSNYPKRIAYLMSKTEMVVIDECDSVIGESLGKKFLACKESRGNRQFLFAGATLPPRRTAKSTSPRAFIEDEFPDCKIVHTQGFHKTPATLRETFVPIEYNSNTKNVFLKNHFAKVVPGTALVYCGSRFRVEKTFEFLKKNRLDNHYNIYRLHSTRPQTEKAETSALLSKPAGTKPRIVIGTDLPSRGIDFADCNRIIHFDFPPRPTDYIHRVGRACRNGSQGTSILLYKKQDPVQSSLVEMYELASQGKTNAKLSSFKNDFVCEQGETITSKTPLTALLQPAGKLAKSLT